MPITATSRASAAAAREVSNSSALETTCAAAGAGSSASASWSAELIPRAEMPHAPTRPARTRSSRPGGPFAAIDRKRRARFVLGAALGNDHVVQQVEVDVVELQPLHAVAQRMVDALRP